MKSSTLIAAVLSFAFGTHLSSAALVRVDIVSMVSHEQNLPIFGFSPSLGDPVEGHFIYDTTAEDLDPGDPLRGIYNIKEVSLSIGGHLFSNDQTAQAVVFDLGGSDIFSIAAGTGVSAQDNLLVDGNPGAGAILFAFRGLVGGDHLPDAATVEALGIDQFHLREENGDLADPTIFFGPNRATEVNAVPEPSGVLLALTGMLVMGFVRRK